MHAPLTRRPLVAIVALLALGLASFASHAHAYGDEPYTSTIRIRLKGPTLRVRCRGGDCAVVVQREGTLFHVSVTRTRPGAAPFTFVRTVDNPKNVAIETGIGTDSVTLLDVNVAGFLRIGTGEGDDLLDVTEASTAGHVSIDTGKGNDVVHLAPGTFGGKFHMNTRNGDDEVTITGGMFVGKSTFDGGQGSDGFATSALGFAEPPVVLGFEH